MGNNVFKKLCRLAGETCVRYRLISDGDRILVGLSGGKDSFVLMHLLEHLQQHAPVKFSLVTATFDPSFTDFGTEKIAAYCAACNWEHHLIKLDVPAIIREKNFDSSPCVLCSRLRRGKLYGLANTLKCNKLALGQHLDDIITSFFMSVCRGQGLSSMAPSVTPKNPSHPTVIRPLALAPEELIRQYAATLDLPQKTGHCQYESTVKTGDRAAFTSLIETLSLKIPNLRENIAHSLTKLEPSHLLLFTGKEVR